LPTLSHAKAEGEVAVLAAASPGWYFLAVLSLLMGFASISTDLYLPAMPEMGRSLNASAGSGLGCLLSMLLLIPQKARNHCVRN